MLGGALAQLALVVQIIVLGRVLGAIGLGEFTLFQTTAVLLANAAGLGLGQAIVKHGSETNLQDRDALAAVAARCQRAVVIGSIALFVIIIFVGTILSPRAFGTSGEWSDLVIVGGYVLAATFYQSHVSLAIAFQQFKAASVLAVVNSLSVVASTVTGALIFTVRGALWGLVAGTALSGIAAYIVNRSGVRDAPEFSGVSGLREQPGSILKYALPSLIASMLTLGAMWFVQWKMRTGGETQELGLFTAASAFRAVLVFVPTIVSRVAMPVLTNLWHAQRPRQFLLGFGFTSALSLVAAVGAAIFMVIVVEDVLLWSGRDFQTGAPVARIMILSGVVESMCMTLFQFVFASGSLWIQAAGNGIWAAVLIGTVEAGHGGAVRLASAYLSAWSVLTVFFLLTVSVTYLCICQRTKTEVSR